MHTCAPICRSSKQSEVEEARLLFVLSLIAILGILPFTLFASRVAINEEFIPIATPIPAETVMIDQLVEFGS